MNKLIDWVISNLKYISNKIYFLINKNLTLNKMYKPIIEEKIDINKKLQETLTTLNNKNKQAENNILKLKKENEVLQSKISIIQNLITKRH